MFQKRNSLRGGQKRSGPTSPQRGGQRQFFRNQEGGGRQAVRLGEKRVDSHDRVEGASTRPQRSFSRGASSSSRMVERGAPRFGRQNFGGRGRSGGSSSHARGARRVVGSSIDISRLTQKAVVTEKAERYVPEHAFVDFPLEQKLKENIAAKGYVTPTPIQDKAILHVLHGQDVVGIANTGTGKTAAFLVPTINKIIKDANERALIVVPTRELALQIEEEFRGFVSKLPIHAVVLIGGASMGLQMRDLRYKHNLIIGTPGRIRDMIERKKINLGQFKTVVLDEADRMLDMGFIGEMRYLMSLMPSDRQTLFFSATLSREIEALIHEFLREPVRISVKTQETSKNIDQDVIRVGAREKIDVLAELLRSEGVEKTLVFGRTKHGVEKLARSLSRLEFKADSIHGDKTMSQRKRALEAFKKGTINILVATDVAARGLDIPNVSHVINYDIPSSYEDYVHRIGRTGRAGNKGKALTFVD